MRFNVTINQQKCLENGLNASQSALMSLLTELSSWASEKMIDGKLYWHISRNKVVQELPLFYEKSDTVYRHFKVLKSLNMIEYLTQNRMDFICLTEAGKGWNKLGNKSEFEPNSEINPRKLGNKSEFNKEVKVLKNKVVSVLNSEINPTYNNYNNTSNEKEEKALSFFERNSPSEWEVFKMRFRKEFDVLEWEKFKELFDLKADEETLEYTTKKISARLTRFAINYVENLKKPVKKLISPEVEVNHPSRKRIS